MGTRGSVNGKAVFLRILDETIKHLTTSINEKIQLNNADKPKGGHPRTITHSDIVHFLGVITHVCGHRAHNFSAHYSKYRDKLISYRQWKKVRRALTFNTLILFECVNTGLQAYVNVGGHGAFDEAIWEYYGDTAFLICIPRKPHDTGVRAYKYCFPLTRSGRPVVFYLLPDLRTPCFTGGETMDAALRQMPPNRTTSVTADSFFCNLNWLRAHPNCPVTFGVASNDVPELSLFSHNLHHHEYRLFTDGKIVLSLWLDNKLVITASNMFDLISPTTKQVYRGSDCSNSEPVLSEHTVDVFGLLSLEELKALARRCGVSTGKYLIL